MSETYDQAEVGSFADGSAAAEVTPLDEILSGETDAADVPASSREDRQSGDHEGEGGERGEIPKVSLSALKRERARRQKMDARVRELEEEVQRFNDQKWGIEEEATDQADSQHIPSEAHDQPLRNSHWEQSHKAFIGRHRAQDVEALQAALYRLTPAQTEEVRRIAGSNAADPAQGVHNYVKRLGLLGFEPRPLQEVIDGKGKQQPPSADAEKIEERFAELTQREQAIHFAERRAIQAASRSEFIAEHGHGTFKELDAVVGILIQNQHPAVAQLQQVYQSSQRPAHAVAALLDQWGMLSTPAAAQSDQRQPQPVYPSNLATSRNAAPRRGPAWSGPSSLQDIFDRRRA